jgi:hypothetical protein
VAAADIATSSSRRRRRLQDTQSDLTQVAHAGGRGGVRGRGMGQQGPHSLSGCAGRCICRWTNFARHTGCIACAPQGCRPHSPSVNGDLACAPTADPGTSD